MSNPRSNHIEGVPLLLEYIGYKIIHNGTPCWLSSWTPEMVRVQFGREFMLQTFVYEIPAAELRWPR